MDFYSTLNSFAPKILSRDYNGQTNEDAADFPPTEDPVYILGNKYSSLHELEEIRLDVRTNIWMTYRRNFPPIGDTSFTSDNGWGCMLRCGQMVLARALSNLNLGKGWRWTYSDHESLKKLFSSDNQEELSKYLQYRNILLLFADIKMAPYSIHQIALMGVCEGKDVGQWFGPNTIAQVLRKLSSFDKKNNFSIYIAMDNIVFLDDIKKTCRSIKGSSNQEKNESSDDDLIVKHWRPLLLFIPLRLGLSEINPVYFRSLKTTFTFPQTLGILGGRPNHALYFIGCCGDDLIYLDPHITQPFVSLAQDKNELEQMLEKKCSLEVDNEQSISSDDVSYHCDKPYRMSFSSLDPSLSLCFFCKTEAEFDQWANLTLRRIMQEKQPLFELMQCRPKEWPVDDTELASASSTNQFCHVNPSKSNDLEEELNSTIMFDEEFEIID